jgi:hypothetical protein
MAKAVNNTRFSKRKHHTNRHIAEDLIRCSICIPATSHPHLPPDLDHLEPTEPMKTYSLVLENHMVLGGLCDSDVQARRDSPRFCAACLSDTDPAQMQYMADVRNYICHDCREFYHEVKQYIKPLRWYE